MTTITGSEPKPWIDAWREKWGPLADRKLAIAGAIGSAFHASVDQYLAIGAEMVVMDEYISCAPRVRAMLRSFITWAAGVNGTIDATELRVVSRTHTYSGTFDAVGTWDGKPMIWDWKTGAGIYPDMDLQLAAYAQAYKEQTGIAIKQGMIVHVSKRKPHHIVTTRMFKLGKRPLNKFLRLRAKFDDARHLEAMNAEATVGEETGC